MYQLLNLDYPSVRPSRKGRSGSPGAAPRPPGPFPQILLDDGTGQVDPVVGRHGGVARLRRPGDARPVTPPLQRQVRRRHATPYPRIDRDRRTDLPVSDETRRAGQHRRPGAGAARSASSGARWHRPRSRGTDRPTRALRYPSRVVPVPSTGPGYAQRDQGAGGHAGQRDAVPAHQAHRDIAGTSDIERAGGIGQRGQVVRDDPEAVLGRGGQAAGMVLDVSIIWPPVRIARRFGWRPGKFWREAGSVRTRYVRPAGVPV